MEIKDLIAIGAGVAAIVGPFIAYNASQTASATSRARLQTQIEDNIKDLKERHTASKAALERTDAELRAELERISGELKAKTDKIEQQLWHEIFPRIEALQTTTTRQMTSPTVPRH